MRQPISTSVAVSAPPWPEVVSAVGAVVAAVAAVAALVVAIVAARYAKKQVEGVRDQLEEARTLRHEQAQPYVVVYAVPSRVNPQLGEIVIKNFGTTGASDVTISSSPALVRTDQQGGSEEVRLPAAMPFLAPGQEWRTFWDSALERKHSSLPDRFDLTVTYTDSLGTRHTIPSVLDWGVFRQRLWVTESTVHNAAKSLDSITKLLKTLTQPDRIQRVATYDGPQLDRQDAQERAEAIRRLNDLDATIRRTPTPPQP